MRLLLFTFAALICEAQSSVICKTSKGGEINCKKGDFCLIEDVKEGIVMDFQKECLYLKQFKTPQDKKKKEMTIKRIRIGDFRSKLFCCPLRISSLACGSFGRRPVKKRVKRIIGGTASDLAEFPHFAALAYIVEEQLSFDCGGALISESFVLTAAHCCPKPKPPIIVRLGKTALSLTDVGDPFKPVDIDVKDIHVHPSYNVSMKYHDIAIIKMKHPATFSYNVWPACVHTEFPPKQKTNFYIAGLGIHDKNSRDKSHWLMKGIVQEIPLTACSELFKKQYSKPSEKFTEVQRNSTKGLPNGITDEMICAKDRNGTKNIDTCQGDSGTALQFMINQDVFNIYGIVSFGLSCQTRLPSFYTRVSSYIDWIEKIVWK